MRWKCCVFILFCVIGFDVSAQERLKSCPDSPNCVSTLTQDTSIKALSMTGEWKQEKQRLLAIIKDMPHFKLHKDDGRYLHFLYTSSWFGFVDDVEFYLGDTQIDMRSASRQGYYDFGTNLKRLQQIQSLWQKD